MNRTIFIIVGVALVFILLGVWIFMLFFGNGAGSDTFADFGFDDTTDDTYVPPIATEEEPSPTISINDSRPLKQLTTEPIIGYQEVLSGTTTAPLIYFVTAGTGHVFTIDTETGEEERVSATTIPSSESAAITPSGDYVLIQSGSGIASSLIVGEISSTSKTMDTIELPDNAVDFAATEENRFLYAVQTNTGLTAKMYNPATGSLSDVFSIPFRDATIQWADSVDGPHYIYPKPTSQLEGYLYRVDGRELSRVPVDGYGLSAIANENYVLYSVNERGFYESYVYNLSTRDTDVFSLPIMPEKCTFMNNQTNMVSCGTMAMEGFSNLPDSWYQGTNQVENTALYTFEINRPFREQVSIPTEIGRDIDMTNLTPSSADDYQLFIDRESQILWMFDNR